MFRARRDEALLWQKSSRLCRDSGFWNLIPDAETGILVAETRIPVARREGTKNVPPSHKQYAIKIIEIHFWDSRHRPVQSRQPSRPASHINMFLKTCPKNMFCCVCDLVTTFKIIFYNSGGNIDCYQYWRHYSTGRLWMTAFSSKYRLPLWILHICDILTSYILRLNATYSLRKKNLILMVFLAVKSTRSVVKYRQQKTHLNIANM